VASVSEGILGAEGSKRIAERQREMEAALQNGRFDEAQRLAAEVKALRDEPRPQAPDPDRVRSLLRLATGLCRGEDGSIQHLILTPFHPIAVRLRALAEDILVAVLSRLWSEGWSEEALDDLDDVLRDWGLPDPLHIYGFWDGNDPLA